MIDPDYLRLEKTPLQVIKEQLRDSEGPERYYYLNDQAVKDFFKEKREARNRSKNSSSDHSKPSRYSSSSSPSVPSVPDPIPEPSLASFDTSSPAILKRASSIPTPPSASSFKANGSYSSYSGDPLPKRSLSGWWKTRKPKICAYIAETDRRSSSGYSGLIPHSRASSARSQKLSFDKAVIPGLFPNFYGDYESEKEDEGFYEAFGHTDDHLRHEEVPLELHPAPEPEYYHINLTKHEKEFLASFAPDVYENDDDDNDDMFYGDYLAYANKFRGTGFQGVYGHTGMV